MSIPAALVDENIVKVNNLNYDAWSIIAFQRTSVILTEVALGVALLRFTRAPSATSQQRILAASLFFHPGFLIIDHVHFQYNGFMFGLLVYSIFMAHEKASKRRFLCHLAELQTYIYVLSSCLLRLAS